jgi:hypothetical protein
MRYLRKNTATRITVGAFFDKTDGITPEVALTVTNEKLTLMVDTGGVPTLVLDTAPTASGGSNDMVHVTNDDAGFYDLELAAADVNYVGRAMLAITDAANHCPVFHEFMILPEVVYDAFVLGTDNLDVSVADLAAGAVNAAAIADNAIDAGAIASDAITAAKIATGAITNAKFAAGAIDAAAIAQDAIDADSLKADAVTEIQNGLSTAAALSTLQGNITTILADYARRTGDYATVAALSTLQGNVTTILADYARRTGDYSVLDAAGVRTAVGLATANLDTQIGDLPTNSELATALAGADDAVLAAVAALNNLSMANIRTAVGLATANLDTQLADLPTNSELATALAGADDATLAAVAALHNLSLADIRTAVGLASANLDTQLTAIDDYLDTEIAAIKAKTDQLVFTVANQVDANALSGGGGLNAAGVRAAIGMASADLDSQLDALSVAAGIGGISWTYNLLDNLGNPIQEANVWVTSDLAGTHTIASGITNSYGDVVFHLDAGTVYVWRHKNGYTFTNPDTEVVA